MIDGIRVSDEIAVIRHDGDRFASPLHRHARAQLLYAMAGVISVTTDSGTWVVPPSRAVWLPPDTDHVTTSHAGIRFRSLLIDTTGFDGVPDRCRVVEVTPLLRELILKLAALTETQGDRAVSEAVICLLMLELAFLPVQPLDLPAPTQAGLADLCDRIRRDPARAHSIAAAAAELAMSRATFMRLFKRETGMGFGRWCQQARMLHALPLLAEGRAILDVALDCGYDSPSAFAAVFRRSFGRPPSAYFRPPPAESVDRG
ncbi:AraC family transcriptional regulator [Methylobacterium sp. WL18]|nr:helix-turn-helix transcriptional regulator [Methylobacterium sp. WL18]TXN47326.1 AraC family transcriptional regulator [Methylobacterium sp. WL18]